MNCGGLFHTHGYFMSGTIIEFRRHPGFGKDRRRPRPLQQGRGRERRLMQQIARIAALLDELDDLNGGHDGGHKGIPLWLVAQARAGLGRVRNGLQPAPEYRGGLPDESDPQPLIDREVLERMYRSLDPQR
jgi:hypothetical protein